MATFSKQVLSASSGGKQIGINLTTSPGNTIHAASAVPTDIDEIWLYATNNGTVVQPISTLWGGQTASDLSTVSLLPNSGRTLISDGKPLQNGSIVTAYMPGGFSTAVVVDGYVNRISNAIDTRVLDWVSRVVANGGATPSTLTQQAMTVFVQGLSYAGLFSKMYMLNCFVPDSLIACQTPLIGSPYLWINHSYLLADLTVNGIVGNASSKFFDTQFNPSIGIQVQSAGGFSYYASTVTATGFIIGCYDGSLAFMGAAKHSDNNSYGYNGAIGNAITVASPGAGFYSDNRVSTTDHRLFFANSTRTLAQIGSTDVAASGSNLPNVLAVTGAERLGGSLQFPSSDRMSFAAWHAGLSLTDATNLFTLVQAFRVSLGGGFV